MAEIHLVEITEKALKNHCKYLDSESIKNFLVNSERSDNLSINLLKQTLSVNCLMCIVYRNCKAQVS